MRRVVRDALIIFFGGLLMWSGVFLSYVSHYFLVQVLVGAALFGYGLYLDLGGVRH